MILYDLFYCGFPFSKHKKTIKMITKKVAKINELMRIGVTNFNGAIIFKMMRSDTYPYEVERLTVLVKYLVAPDDLIPLIK